MKLTKKSILLSIIVLICFSQALFAGPRTSPFEPPKETDTVIIVDDSPGLDTGCTFRNGGPLVIKMKMPRYVGDVDSNGYLKNISTLINNKIISATAILTLPAFDVDYEADVQQYGFNPERDTITFNGVQVKRTGTSESYIYGKDGIWISNSFEIPIGIIKFAKKGVPAENTISIAIDQANLGGDEYWCMSVDWTALQFEAMPPVVLIHGNSSDGAFWDRQGFTEVLQEKKIPYDNSINLPTDTIATNGATLKNRIQTVANDMGVQNIQIVAHSKGGLDTREFLSSYYPDLKKKGKLKIHTFTTLSTPHKGSVGADYLRAYQQLRNYKLDNPNDRTALAEFLSGDGWSFNGDPYTADQWRANQNLTTAHVNSSFNPKNNLPSDIQYFYACADADANNNGSLERTEYQEILDESGNSETKDKYVNGKMNLMYSTMGNFSRVGIRNTGRENFWGTPIYEVVETRTSSFKENDMLVTTESAQHNNFRFIKKFDKNHSSVVDQEVAREVIKKLKYLN